jgi:hypothetical protein
MKVICSLAVIMLAIGPQGLQVKTQPRTMDFKVIKIARLPS